MEDQEASLEGLGAMEVGQSSDSGSESSSSSGDSSATSDESSSDEEEEEEAGEDQDIDRQQPSREDKDYRRHSLAMDEEGTSTMIENVS